MDSATIFFTTWEVEYTGGTPETYLLPLAFAEGDRAFELRQTNAAIDHRTAENQDKEAKRRDALRRAL